MAMFYVLRVFFKEKNTYVELTQINRPMEGNHENMKMHKIQGQESVWKRHVIHTVGKRQLNNYLGNKLEFLYYKTF